MTTIKITVRLSRKALKKLCSHYNENTNTAAIHRCVYEGILQQALYQKSKRTRTPEETFKAAAKDISPDKIPISIRIYEEEINYLKQYYGTANNTYALRCRISDVLNQTAKKPEIMPWNKLFYMTGQKNREMLDFLNPIFKDICSNYRIDGYAEPFCGTANVLLHTSETDAEFLNDNSTDLINLLRVIQQHCYEFFLVLLSIEPSKSTFSRFKEELKQPF